MPRDNLYADDVEADVRSAFGEGTGAANPETEFWGGAQAREDAAAERRGRDSGAADDHHRREREATKERYRETRYQESGGEGWRTRPKAKPPAYLDDKGKEEWQREQDVRDAYAETHGRARERADIERYHQQAAESGTTLRGALSRYTAAEALLRQDPLSGLALIARQAGVRIGDARDYFAALEGEPYAFLGAGQRAVLDKEAAGGQRFMAHHGNVTHAIDAATKHLPNFEAMADDIAELFEKGQVRLSGDPSRDLLNAYHTVASRRAADRKSAGEARRASRSITGSASGDGATPESRRSRRYDSDLEADVARAYDQAAGRL